MLLSWDDYNRLIANQKSPTVHTAPRSYSHHPQTGLTPLDKTDQTADHQWNSPRAREEASPNKKRPSFIPDVEEGDAGQGSIDQGVNSKWFTTWEPVVFKR